MKHAFETRDIALNLLVLHPQNVRAEHGSGYSVEQIAPLAANIAECGLLQPLLVAPLPDQDGQKRWGVLAGGRRLAALTALAQDKSIKAFGAKMEIACRVVPEAHAAQVTLSFSENALQLPMDALDRYEAFAAMQTRDGADVARIARTFAITERVVKESLRLGNIHADIRRAHRDGKLSLEALKAFDGHPDSAVQLEAFTALSETANGRIQQWEVQRYFQGRYVRVGDALGQLVVEGYKAAGGQVIADLIEEDSVLADSALVDKVLRQVLSDAAEARREALGLAWSEIMLEPDYAATSAFGRIYRQPIELDGDAATKGDALALRMAEIEEAFDEEGDEDAQAALQDEYDGLGEQLEELTNAYTALDAALGGVLAIWNGRSITLHDGMVRPEDMPERKASGAAASLAPAPEIAAQDKWSDKLRADMAHIRTRAIGLALAQSPELARDYADFSLIRSILKPYSSHASGCTIQAEIGTKGPLDPEGSLQIIEEVFATLAGQQAVEWLDLPVAEGFAAFRVLTTEDRMMLLAFAVAQTLKPCLAEPRLNPLRRQIEAEALPNIRDVWTPDAAYFGRLTKPALLAILNIDLAMPSESASYAASKKSEIVDYLHALFAAPFATLSEDQRARVLVWAPAAMQTLPLEPALAADLDEADTLGIEPEAIAA